MKKIPTSVWALAVLVLLLIFNAALTPGFFALSMRDGRLFGSLVDILNRAAPVALLSMGMTLVIATGGVDLSVGAVMAVAGAVAAGLISHPAGTPFAGANLGGSIPTVMLISTLVALGCGLFNGILVAYLGFQPIVATLLLMVAGRGFAQLLANGQIVTFQSPEFQKIGTGALLALPLPVWIAVIAFALFTLLTRATALGLFIEATGSNPVAARYVGINAKTIKLAVYALTGICAGIAGMIVTADIQAADASNAGLNFELDAILAVSVGGTALAGGRFSLVGSLVGALLMQTMTTTINTRGIPPEITLVTKAIIVVLVCLMQAPSFRLAILQFFIPIFKRAGGDAK